MVLSVDEIRSLLKTKWPNLVYVWPRSSHYFVPTFEDLNTIVLTTTADTVETIPGIFECEHRTLMFLDQIMQYRLAKYFAGEIKKEDQFSYCIAEAIGDFKVSVETHSLAIAICDDKQIYLIEPSDKSIWIADKNIDKPFFVDFH